VGAKLMTKITEIDRKLQVKHLNDLSKATIKANIKHSLNIQKQIDHTIVLTKIIQEDRAKISRLENVIDMKQREIDELNSKEMNLLWDLSKLQKDNGALQEYKDNNERDVGYWEKKIMSHIKKGKDN
jgi:FtsZ-binding cell division protein ZapB